MKLLPFSILLFLLQTANAQVQDTFKYEMAAVSKNGRMVYLSNKINNKDHVFLKDLRSSKPAIAIAEGGMPKIAPNGGQVVFEEAENILVVYDVATGAKQQISSKIKLPGIQTASWSTTEKNTIYFAAGVFPNLGIYKFSLDNNKLDTIVNTPALRYGCVQSPDGKKIAYRYAKGTSAANMRKGIAVMDLATKEENLITSIGEYCNWSPDSRQLAFHWTDSSVFAIYIVNADGTGLKKLTAVKDGSSEMPSWSPDGKSIYFQTKRRKGAWEIWKMNADGSDQQAFMF